VIADPGVAAGRVFAEVDAGKLYDFQKFPVNLAKSRAVSANSLEELAAGTPRIEALSTLGNRSLLPPLRKSTANVVNKLQVVSMTLQPGEDLIVGRRIREVLNKARKAKA